MKKNKFGFLLPTVWEDGSGIYKQTFFNYIQRYYPELSINGCEMDENASFDQRISNLPYGAAVIFGADNQYDITWYANASCACSKTGVAVEWTLIDNIDDICKAVDIYVYANYPQSHPIDFDKKPNYQTKIAEQAAPIGITQLHLKNGWTVTMYPDLWRVDTIDKYVSIPLVSSNTPEFEYDTIQNQVIDTLRNLLNSDEGVVKKTINTDDIEQKNKENYAGYNNNNHPHP
jgi:hypothetical protein